MNQTESLIEPIEPKEYYFESTQDILVEVFPTYVPERSAPEHKQYFYSYKVKITNNSEAACRVIHRHWKIKDGNGKTYDVQGSGVVGEQPMLAPGESFEYTSFCPLHSPYGNMRGKYQMIDEFGNRFWISVPLFFFRPPRTLLSSEVESDIIQ
ncbi:MAG: Co2+/Mg2+ efflux protein ApaG [Bacteriovoracaceae bacterium]|nr:Co2+/Mg2+ efflux protein ApaG [Bacteriovoracaceae bacterium]